MSIISLSLPNELLEQLDTILGEDRGANRSEVVRQAVRMYLTQFSELGHEFDDMITAYLHSHISETSCLEVMVVKGASERLRSLIDGLKANKPVKQIKVSVMSINEKEQ